MIETNDTSTKLDEDYLRSVIDEKFKLTGNNDFGPCACIGPPGDCPCIRKSRGLKVPISETYISEELFNLLSDEDKNTINSLKHKALGLWMTRRGK